MSSEIRLKKLRGSGGYVMANISDEEQMKGNLGGADLFLAPIGRLAEGKISRHFCNTCDKEFDGHPNIQYENPNELVAENLFLAEKGQYLCRTCNGTIAEYREFKKQNEAMEIGNARPLEPEVPRPDIAGPEVAVPDTAEAAVPVEPEIKQPEIPAQAAADVRQDAPDSISSIEGKIVYDVNANSVGRARQVGIDASQSVMLLITKNDGTNASIPWNSIKIIGEVILLGEEAQKVQPQDTPEACKCGFENREGSKFCEECGIKLPA